MQPACGGIVDPLDKERLRELLSGTAGKIVCAEIAHNTNDIAFELAGRTALPALVCCENQTHGRGRLGRKWAGASYVSLMFTLLFGWENRPVDGLSLAAGLGVQQALRARGARALVKWPNDLVAENGGKLAGVLVEIRGSPRRAAIGIGANLFRDDAVLRAAGKEAAPAFLGELADCSNRNALLAEIARMVAARVREFGCGGFAPLRHAWMSASVHSPGDRISISVPGEAKIEGEYAGVTESGRLTALAGGELREFASAEICTA